MFECSHLGTTVLLFFFEMSNCFRVGGIKSNALCWKENWTRVCPSNEWATDFSNNIGECLVVCLYLFMDRLHSDMNVWHSWMSWKFLHCAGIWPLLLLAKHVIGCSAAFHSLEDLKKINKWGRGKNTLLVNVNVLKHIYFWMLNAAGIISLLHLHMFRFDFSSEDNNGLFN